jgi:hypothetical protein
MYWFRTISIFKEVDVDKGLEGFTAQNLHRESGWDCVSDCIEIQIAKMREILTLPRE